MSTHPSTGAGARPLSIHDIQAYRDRGERFAMLTAYDALTASILDDAGVPVLLVGDSLGMVVLGYDSTVPVSMEDMVHHTAAVRRGARRAVIVADMPFGSYHGSLDEAVANAGRLLRVGANAVKIEGGGRTVEATARMVDAGIPVMGHLGLTPQHVNRFGGFKVQGRRVEQADQIVADARAMEEAGAFSLVIECVPSEVGRRIDEAVGIPTIGIGAGADMTGQVLVVDDMLGRTTAPLPRFVKAYADLRSAMTDAVKTYQAEVASGDYPGPEHRY
jgi:3-methyl-2-oxobutanoate hydroxymethyltransferase